MIAITHALSTALFHFVWQGLLVSVFLWAVLSLMRGRSANSRYVASCAALAVLAVMPVVTMCVVYARPISARTGTVLAQVTAGFLSNTGGARIDWLALLQAWALPIWSCGVLLFSMRLLWGYRQVSALRRAGEPAEAAVTEMVVRLAERMRVVRPVRVLISSIADGPSVVGWLRPLILLPAATVLGLTPEQLEAVFAHELAHIRRYDYLVNLLQMLVETLFFYHPAVWWISGRIRHERELCCDDAAVLCCGDAISYARALTTLERMRVMAPALALGVTDGPMLYRVQRLLGTAPREYRTSRLPAALAICLAIACLGLNTNRARGQAQAPVAEDRPGVTVDLRGSSLMHRPPVSYPEAAQPKGVRGTISVEVTLDAGGNVTDAHVLSGPEEFRRTVLESVLRWHFAPGAAEARQQVDIAFQPPPAETKAPEGMANVEHDGKMYAFAIAREGGDLSAEIEARIRETKAQVEAAPRDQTTMRVLEEQLRELATARSESQTSSHTLGSIEIRGLSDAASAELRSRLPVHLGDVIASASIQAAREIVKQFDEHLELRVTQGDGNYTFQIFPAGSAGELGFNRRER